MVGYVLALFVDQLTGEASLLPPLLCTASVERSGQQLAEA